MCSSLSIQAAVVACSCRNCYWSLRKVKIARYAKCFLSLMKCLYQSICSVPLDTTLYSISFHNFLAFLGNLFDNQQLYYICHRNFILNLYLTWNNFLCLLSVDCSDSWHQPGQYQQPDLSSASFDDVQLKVSNYYDSIFNLTLLLNGSLQYLKDANCFGFSQIREHQQSHSSD